MGCARCQRSKVPAVVPHKAARVYGGLPLCMNCFRAVVSTNEKDQQLHEEECS